MIIKSIFPELCDVEVPDGSTIETIKHGGYPFRTISHSKGYITEGNDSYKGPWRRFFDLKDNMHRPESEGPAHEVPLLGMKSYFKHGKRHRISGPAFYTAVGDQLYYLNGVECTKELHEKYASVGKLPKPTKFDTKILKAKAVELSKIARANKSVNGMAIPEDELDQLDEACKMSSWRKYPESSTLRNGYTEFNLNCEPLDDTLRCYIIVDANQEIVDSYLSVE